MKNIETVNIENNSKYQHFLNTFMNEAMQESLKYPDDSQIFYNIGGNLAEALKREITPVDFERNYDTECIALKNSYDHLRQIKQNIPAEVLSQNKYNFVRSIDDFLNGMFDTVGTKEIALGHLENKEHILYVSITHDCIEKACEIIGALESLEEQ